MRNRGRLAVAAMWMLAAGPAAGQEVALKGGVARSSFQIDGTTPWDAPLLASSLGGHVRFRLGPIAFQPELHVLTRGAKMTSSDANEQLRIEYLEIPLLLALPVTVGAFEAVAFAGPMIALETRCRYIFEEGGLRTNVGCTPPRDPVFARRAADYGGVVGGGVSRSIGSGRVLIEARHTWGMRNIYEGEGATSLHNRTFAILLGYVVAWDPEIM